MHLQNNNHKQYIIIMIYSYSKVVKVGSEIEAICVILRAGQATPVPDGKVPDI